MRAHTRARISSGPELIPAFSNSHNYAFTRLLYQKYLNPLTENGSIDRPRVCWVVCLQILLLPLTRFCVNQGKLKKTHQYTFSALQLCSFPSPGGTTVSLMEKEKVFCMGEFAELLSWLQRDSNLICGFLRCSFLLRSLCQWSVREHLVWLLEWFVERSLHFRCKARCSLSWHTECFLLLCQYDKYSGAPAWWKYVQLSRPENVQFVLNSTAFS